MPARWQQWYSHDINAWNASLAVQSFTDAGYRAFHNLLMAQFESEDGMLPNDPKQLSKLSRMGVRWLEPRVGLPTIAEEVLEEFETVNARIYNPRMFKEWQIAKDNFDKKYRTPEEVSELRSKAGKKGAEARWQNDGNLPSTNGKTDGKPMANAIDAWQNDGKVIANDGTTIPNHTVPNHTQPEPDISPEMVARGVLTETRIAGRWLAVDLERVCKAELDAGADATKLRDSMVSAWQEYEKARPNLDCPVGAEKFFGQGVWKNKAGWKWKQGYSPPQPKVKRDAAYERTQAMFRQQELERQQIEQERENLC